MIEVAPPSNAMSYDEALLYCQFLEHNGYSDWRMPTKQEWLDNDNIIGWHTTIRLQHLDRSVIPVRDV